MTLTQLIKLEDNAKEVWVISPSLHYDVANKDFSELVNVNLGQNTKYKYIVPASSEIHKNLELYKKMYDLTEDDIHLNFLLLSESDLQPFMMEIGIYDGNSDCQACAAPALEEGSEVIKFDKATSEQMAKDFKAIWKKYKRVNL